MRSLLRVDARTLLAAGVVLVAGTPALAGETREAERLLARLLEPPVIRGEPGFAVRMLVPPGELYDPLDMVARDGGRVWVVDDGGAEGEKGEEGETGSRILEIDTEGKVSELVGLDKVPSMVGFDVAPSGFGDFGGQVFATAQAKVGWEGATGGHIILRLDPGKRFTATKVCSLPPTDGGPAGGGADTRFGPAGTAFAGRLFAITFFNATVYEVTPDGACKPFVELRKPLAGALGMAFPAGGREMLLTATEGEGEAARGLVLRVSARGAIGTEPFFHGRVRPAGIAIAPAGFGKFAGEVFVAETGPVEVPVPVGQPLANDGKLYRIDSKGAAHLVASGFQNPMYMLFTGERLLVGDIAGDFTGGRRELPDGFIVEVRGGL